MSDRSGLFSLEVSLNSMTVDIHDCTDIHTFKFKKYFFVFIFFFKKYFLSIPCFSPPTTFSGSCIQISITFIETVRQAYGLPFAIIKSYVGQLLLRPDITTNRMHQKFPYFGRQIFLIRRKTFRNGKTHITVRAGNRNRKQSSRDYGNITYRIIDRLRKNIFFMQFAFLYRKSIR